MIHQGKNDPHLGERVNDHLTKIGVETPFNSQIAKTKQIDFIADSMKSILVHMGLDLNDDSLEDTPKRYAKMFVNELCYGLNYEHFPKCTVVENKIDSGMVIEKDINVMSICEHHLVTIDGYATVAYIPKAKILGLSKINRIVDFFSRRPQIQERLTNQIWHTLNLILETDDIAVYIDAVHYCVKSRGASDQSSHTVTNKLGGAFKNDPATRSEFMSLAKK